MGRPGDRSTLRTIAILIAVCVVGVAGAAGGFVVGRRWPIEFLEPLLWPIRSSEPAPFWREFSRTDFPRYENARAVIDGQLYLIGGFWTGDPKATNRVESIDLTTGSWRRFKDMPVPLTHANAVVMDGVIWLAGGFEGDHPGPATARVWRWDVKADVWSEGPPLPAPRASGVLAEVGGTLHYFGGYLPDRNTNSPDHWRLLPGGSTWEPRAPFPHPRGHVSGVVVDGSIYALSGNYGHDPTPVDVAVAERYDPTTDMWETVTPPPFPMSHDEGASFLHDGHIVMIGGRSRPYARENQDDILSFNPRSGKWSHVGRLPMTLLGATGIVQGDTVTVGLGASRYFTPDNPVVWRGSLRNTWRTADPASVSLGEVAGGVVNGALYLVGQGSRSTLRYDLARGVWTQRGADDRPAPGNHHAAEVLDRRLWLFGGLGAGSEGLVQVLDTESGEWQLGPPMPFRAGSSASAVIDGKFFVAGGIVGQATTDAAAMLDPVSMTWTSLAPMPRPRNHAASATDGTRLFVFGGRGPGSGDSNVVADGFDDVQVYDPLANTWLVSDGTNGAPLPLPQARGGTGKAVWLNGEFWIIGGETEHGAGATALRTYDRVDVYNPRTNQWRRGPALPTARHGIFPLEYEGQIVVAAGGVQAGASRSSVVEIIWPRQPEDGASH
jgi:N-acetylneuraminic acid mutarotase